MKEDIRRDEFYMALTEFPIPGIVFFMNGNVFTGSLKGMNYRIVPIKSKAEEEIEAHFEVSVWDGLLCSDLAEIQDRAEFPLDADGLAALVVGLGEEKTKRE